MFARRLLNVSRASLSSSSSRFASSLVIAEHEGGKLTAGSLSTIAAALQLKGSVAVLVAGAGETVKAAAADASKVQGVSKVLSLESDLLANPLAEEMSRAIEAIASPASFSHILAPSTNHSKNSLPRAAARLSCSPVNDVMAVVDETTFKRPVYAGNAIATVKNHSPIKFLLVRTTAFEKAAYGGSSAPVESANVKLEKHPANSTFLSSSVKKSDRPELTTARVVVAGGRALKSAENFAIIEKLADKLKGAVGASRAAVDAGYISNEHQIGQTGKVVAPELYIGCGISGAIQHLSGMKDSKVIVVINKDKEAPFFQVADYGLVEDLFKAVPEMESKL